MRRCSRGHSLFQRAFRFDYLFPGVSLFISLFPLILHLLTPSTGCPHLTLLTLLTFPPIYSLLSDLTDLISPRTPKSQSPKLKFQNRNATLTSHRSHYLASNRDLPPVDSALSHAKRARYVLSRCRVPR